jgi:glutathione S-transferase
MASQLILHHYDASPFSEKIRRILAFKGVPWRAVEQPQIMPKPDLVPLTGGYRRIPVLQIGADVYCDTTLIVRKIEELHPTPTLYPRASEGTCHAWNLLADRSLFLATVPVVFAEIGGHVPKAFIDDRTKMIPGRDFAQIPAEAPHAREQLRALVALLEAQLADGRPHLLGREFSLADAACFHPLWFLRIAPQAGTLLAEFPNTQSWFNALDAVGHGARTQMEPTEALAVARDSRPAPPPPTSAHEANGIAPGTRVAVLPDDYGFDPVVGEVVSASAVDISVRRNDPAVGEVVVHFPRLGFRVRREN